jgi:chaperonin GroEL (HSP60 family)
MMFLQFAIWGAWFVVFFPYLVKHHGFTGTQAGALIGNMALGAIVSTIFAGYVADRLVSSEKLMAFCHLGGAALLYATRALDNKRGANHDQQVGMDIVRRALQAPVRQIAENAGFDGAVVAGRMLDQKDVNYGFDAQKSEYVNMFKAGIIDPTKVVRAALQGAVSVAGLLITTEAMVVEGPKDPAPPMPPGGGMGGMGGMGF